MSKRRKPRQPAGRSERQQDPRLVTTRATAMDGKPLPPNHWVTVVSPVRMDDGRKLMWHPPQPVAFNLIEASRLASRGSRQRRAILGNLKGRDDDGYMPGNSKATLDCLSDLAGAVLFAFTAVESLANHVIDMLPDDATVTRRKQVVAKQEMTRALGIDEKYKLVIPTVDGCEAIAGTATWERYRDLKFLRDELLHVKERGYLPGLDDRTAYDRLILGEGDNCANDALSVVEGAWPGFLPDEVLAAVT